MKKLFLSGSRLEFNWTVVDKNDQIKITSIQSRVDNRSTHSFTFQMNHKPLNSQCHTVSGDSLQSISLFFTLDLSQMSLTNINSSWLQKQHHYFNNICDNSCLSGAHQAYCILSSFNNQPYDFKAFVISFSIYSQITL